MDSEMEFYRASSQHERYPLLSEIRQAAEKKKSLSALEEAKEGFMPLLVKQADGWNLDAVEINLYCHAFD